MLEASPFLKRKEEGLIGVGWVLGGEERLVGGGETVIRQELIN